MKNSKTVFFLGLFLTIGLISFSSFTKFQNLKTYQEKIKLVSDSTSYTILFGDLTSGTYDTSLLLEQKELRVNRIIGDKTIENYLTVTKYSVLLLPMDKSLNARVLSVSSNKTEIIYKLLENSKPGDKLIIAEVEGHDAEGNRLKINDSLAITLK